MRLYAIAHLHGVRLKARAVLVQELAVALGIAVGVALLFGTQIASSSLGGSILQLTEGVVGRAQYQLEARSSAGFGEQLLQQVQQLRGVRAAMPVLEQNINVAGPGGRQAVDLIATKLGDVRLAGPLLRALASSSLERRILARLKQAYAPGGTAAMRLAENLTQLGRMLVLPAPVARAIGAKAPGAVEVSSGSARTQVALDASLTSSEIGPLVDSPVALAPLDAAQTITGMQGRITRVFVQAQPGRSHEVLDGLLRLAAGRLNVEPADFDATVFDQAALPLSQSTDTYAAICALIGFIFAGCSLLLTAHLRQRLVRELHMIGVTRPGIARVLLFDGLALGLLGSALGLVLGDLLSLAVFRSNPGFLSFAFPLGTQRVVTWQSAALAAGAGVLTACAGVLTAVRSSSPTARRTRHGRNPAAAGPSRALSSAAAVAFGAATLIMILAPQSAIVGISTLTIALLLALPLVFDLVTAAFARIRPLADAASAGLALLELRSPHTRLRSLGVVAIAAESVFISVLIQATSGNLRDGLRRAGHGIATVADLWVVAPGNQNLLNIQSFDRPTQAAIAALPGVRTVGVDRASLLEVGDRRVVVMAPSPAVAFPISQAELVQGNLAVARARLREGGWAIVSQTIADQHHLHLGGRFLLPAPRPRSFRIAALSTNLGWSPGAVVLGPGDFLRAWGSSEPTAYNVALAPGASPARVEREIRRVLVSAGATGLTVEPAAAREHSEDALVDQGLERLSQIAKIALLAGILAAGVAVVAVLWQRRGHCARLKTQGFPGRTLWAAAVWESTLLIGTGCVCGALVGAYGQLLLSRALLSVMGFPMVLQARPLIAVEYAAAFAALAAAIVAAVGWRVIQTPAGARS
jgi:putative ABC transport system permease protein